MGPRLLESTVSKDKKSENYTLSYYITPEIMPLHLNFLNIDAHQQSAMDRSWHDSTKVTSLKQDRKTLALDYGKVTALYQFQVKGMSVIFHRKRLKQNGFWNI